MPSCAVRVCNSKSGKPTRSGVKRHFFRVSKDKNLQKLWREALNREDLTSNHFVCDKHFPPEKTK